MSKSDLLLLFVIASIPIQFGKFFWPSFSYVLGIPIDYRAITFYLSDILIIGYFLFFLVDYFFQKKSESYKNFIKFCQENKWFLSSIIFFNCYLLVGAAISRSPKIVPFYFSLKILEFSLLSILASVTLSKPKMHSKVNLILTISLFWQSLLIISQFLFQKSLGLWILGERSFDSTTVGIAHAQLFGVELLRPYGTFPHPNVAGAYLVISLLWLFAYPSSEIRLARYKFTALFILLATFLTFSKTALLATVVVFLASVKRIIYFFLSSALVVLFFIFSFKFFVESQIASIAERLILSQAALDITFKNPLFGVGSGNFVFELGKLNLFSIAEVRLLQPVHNVFLLLLAENGIIGLLIFAFLLISAARGTTSPYKFVLFIVILLFASVDHFFWTLNQGRLLFWLTLSFLISSPKTALS